MLGLKFELVDKSLCALMPGIFFFCAKQRKLCYCCCAPKACGLLRGEKSKNLSFAAYNGLSPVSSLPLETEAIRARAVIIGTHSIST